jgi:serine phosphatase RsbU (regulator of sigma subunit)
MNRDATAPRRVRRRLLPFADGLLRLFPPVVILLVIVIAFSTPSNVHIGPLLAVAPALAGLTQDSPRGPVLNGLLAIGVAFLLSASGQGNGGGEPFISLLAVGLVSAIAWAGVHIRIRQERTLQEVRSVAEAAQEVLLRPVPRRIGRLAAGVRYRAAAAEARIGGDLYEVIHTPFGVRAVVGDVRGKGLDAVQTAAAVLGAFREAAYEEPHLPGVVRRLAASLRRRLDRDDEEFVTLVLLGFPESGPDAGHLQVVNCGHPPPLLLRAAGCRPLDPPAATPPLGILDPMLMDIPVLRTRLQGNDRVLLYTDGIIEARDETGAFYPLADRAADSLPGVDETLDRIDADVQRHVGHPLQDDAAMLLLQYTPLDVRVDLPLLELQLDD